MESADQREGDIVKVGFVRSRKPYRSYDDFWRLVALSGFDQAWADLADLGESGRLWVWPTMNMEFMGRVLAAGRRRKARVAWWYLERPDANLPEGADPVSAWKAAVAEALEAVDAVWVSDRSLAQLEPLAVYAALGSDPGLAEVARLPARYDIAFMGQRTPRRAAAIAAIEARGLSVTPDCHGLARASALASSKISLVVDRTERMRVVAPLRWAVTAAYGLAILQEELPDPWPLAPGRSIAMAPLSGIPEAAVELAAGTGWSGLGREAWQVLCRDLTFREGVLQAARATA